VIQPLACQPSIDWDAALSAIEQRLDQTTQFDGDCPPVLREAIRYSVLAPGKRLRPRLVIAACAACGGTIDAALAPATAVELIHVYSLVHDDLPSMDDDTMRRGQPCCHVKFGEATAILVGDALVARAFEILAREVTPPAIATQCVATLARAAGASQLVGGQVDDLDEGARVSDTADLDRVYERKTGALISAALELGGRVAGASTSQLAALAAFGRRLGLAFQITDDLLDFSTVRATIDAGSTKPSRSICYPDLVGVEASRQRVVELVADAVMALDEFGDRGEALRSMARSLVDRTH
jgi:geranylgeranyl diphosphate synthase type II